MDCYQSSLEYSGLVLHMTVATCWPIIPADDPVNWNLTINVRTAWVVPAPLLRTAGQTLGRLYRRAAERRNVSRPAGRRLPRRHAPRRIRFLLAAEHSECRSVPCRVVADILPSSCPGHDSGRRRSRTRGHQEFVPAAVPLRSSDDPTRPRPVSWPSGPRCRPTTPRSCRRLPQQLNVVCYIEPLAHPLSGTVVGLAGPPDPVRQVNDATGVSPRLSAARNPDRTVADSCRVRAMTSAGLPKAVVEPVTFEHHREALGIGEARPRISWRVVSERPGWVQQAYEIRVTGGGLLLHVRPRSPPLESVLVPWPDAPLLSRTRATGECPGLGRRRGSRPPTGASRHRWRPDCSNPRIGRRS